MHAHTHTYTHTHARTHARPRKQAQRNNRREPNTDTQTKVHKSMLAYTHRHPSRPNNTHMHTNRLSSSHTQTDYIISTPNPDTHTNLSTHEQCFRHKLQGHGKQRSHTHTHSVEKCFSTLLSSGSLLPPVSLTLSLALCVRVYVCMYVRGHV